eukprot:557089-Pyramimonas_sp.AAC.1
MPLDLTGPTPKKRPRSDCQPPAPPALPAPGNIEHSKANQRAHTLPKRRRFRNQWRSERQRRTGLNAFGRRRTAAPAAAAASGAAAATSGRRPAGASLGLRRSCRSCSHSRRC